MTVKTFTMISYEAIGRLARVAAAALPAMLIAASPAHAGGSETETCIHSGGTFVCNSQWGPGRGSFPQIIAVPSPASEREAAEAAERDRRWVTRCRPVVRRDRYGVGRYSYAAPGCEFGKLED